MEVVVALLMICACGAGFVLFRRHTIPAVPPDSSSSVVAAKRLSVIIPARNEERNLPHLLQSLQSQQLPSSLQLEVIVVDDCSEDRTRAVAESFGVKAIANETLPPGWTGKNWAVWNGYLHATGDMLAFLDADVRLSPDALHALLAAVERTEGAVSVVPYHQADKLYERLALIPNVLGLFAFTSPMEQSNPNKGLYGSCILVSREHYEKAQGHEGVKSELLDDLNLGAAMIRAGVPVTNYIGHGRVSFRMYPGGIRSEIEGFSKGAVLSTGKLSGWTTLLVAVWLIGLIAAEAAPLLLGMGWALPLAAGYVLYTAQLYYFLHYTGRFGWWLPAIHLLSTVFFLYIMLYSIYQVVFFGRVAWKGRQIEVGGRRKL